jgi:hypothetical protein
MLSRKDRVLHQEPNKIGFAFLCYDFLQIFEVATETLIHIYRRTLILFSRNYAEVPGLRKYPWKERGRHNVVPGAPAGGEVQNPVRRKPCLTGKELGSGVGSPRTSF